MDHTVFHEWLINKQIFSKGGIFRVWIVTPPNEELKTILASPFVLHYTNIVLCLQIFHPKHPRMSWSLSLPVF